MSITFKDAATVALNIKKRGIPAPTVKEMWNDRANIGLGKGVYGEARLYHVKSDAEAAMYGTTAIVLKEFKGYHSVRLKSEEETVHLLIYSRLGASCRRFICDPIPTLHPTISAQKAHETQGVTETVLDFIENQHMDQSSAGQVLTLWARAMNCLHNVGVLHGDVKTDNVIISYRPTPSGLKDIRLAVIDFGLSRASRNGKPLFPKTACMNYTKYNASHPCAKNYPPHMIYTNSKVFLNRTKNIMNALPLDSAAKAIVTNIDNMHKGLHPRHFVTHYEKARNAKVDAFLNGIRALRIKRARTPQPKKNISKQPKENTSKTTKKTRRTITIRHSKWKL